MGHSFLLVLPLALLLITSTHRHSTTGHAQAAITEAKQGVESMMRAVHSITVGSRPPSCEGRCRSCGRCEAVQVPVTPQAELQKKRRRRSSSSGCSSDGGGRGSRRTRTGAAALLQPSSYDDHSNYKPLSWRCKCGGMLINP